MPRPGQARAAPRNSPRSGGPAEPDRELYLSDVAMVANRIGDVFGVDPGSLRFMRLQASMLFRGDDGWVYRVPARTKSRERFVAESDLMALLAERMPVATPIWQVAADFPAARYKYIPGQPFDFRLIEEGSGGERLLSDLAAFLSALHATPSPTPEPETSKIRGIRPRMRRLRECGRPDLADRLEQSVARFVAATADRPTVLCHGDLNRGNILIDTAARKIVGIIDFTSWTIAPPEVDLAKTGFPEPLLQRLVEHYEALRGISVDRDTLTAASQMFACRTDVKQALESSG